jgi:hypothetical protein
MRIDIIKSNVEIEIGYLIVRPSNIYEIIIDINDSLNTIKTVQLAPLFDSNKRSSGNYICEYNYKSFDDEKNRIVGIYEILNSNHPMYSPLGTMAKTRIDILKNYNIDLSKKYILVKYQIQEPTPEIELDGYSMYIKNLY